MKNNNMLVFLLVLLISSLIGCPNCEIEKSKTDKSKVGPVTETKAGVKPENVKGSQPLPQILAPITDRLYIVDSSTDGNEPISGYLAAYEISDVSTCQWYTGTTGNWEKITDATTDTLCITATVGITYYMLEAKSEDGKSIAYSNICTVEYGTEKTKNIGKIAYSDGSYSDSYEIDKTPIGIIYDVDESGNPTKIVNLNNSQNKYCWCIDSAEGYNINFIKDVKTPLSYTDGTDNWKIICEKVTDEDEDIAGNYPVFEYVNKLTIGDKKWYVPARDELVRICFNKTVINNAIKVLKQNSITATDLPDFMVLSSSQFVTDNTSIWTVYFWINKQVVDKKSGDKDIRVVANF